MEPFPNRQRRQPRIVQAEQDLNLEIEKIIGHERRRNSIRFLCKWEGFFDEDATYRVSEDFRTSPYGVRVIKYYINSFSELPQELREWARETDWMQDTSNAREAELPLEKGGCRVPK